jgi:DNA-binding transcriptional regulator YiaG
MVKRSLSLAHECDTHAVEHTSSAQLPYHYVNSGLDNVYLIGVKCFVCNSCGAQSAEIPSLVHLLSAIGRELVAKSSPLTGKQVRFLRKRLQKSSKDFARFISMTPQRLATLENEDGNADVAAGRDKLVRMVYKLLSGDQRLMGILEKPEEVERWLTSIHGSGRSERIIATWQRNHQWKVESTSIAA